MCIFIFCVCVTHTPSASQEITFTGKDYFSLQVAADSQAGASFEEDLSVEFKTSRSTGLLLYAGNPDDYLVLGIQDAGLYFRLNIRGELIERTLTTPGTVLNNNVWHSLKVTRRTAQVEVFIDGVRRDASQIAGKYVARRAGAIYVGGAPEQGTVYRTIAKNFVGCVIRQLA